MGNREEVVCNVDIADVNLKVLEKYIEIYSLDPTGDVAGDVEALSKYFESVDVQKVECDCGGKSPADLPECPFCGDSDEVNTTGKAPTTPVEKAKAVPKVKSNPRKKAETVEPTAVAAEVVEPAEPTGTEIIPSDDDANPLGKYTVADLTALTKAINKSAKRAMGEIHAIGAALGVINETGMWKLRRYHGKRKYKNFKAFVEDEIQISYGHGYKLINVSKNFTVKDLEAHGVNCLTMSLKLPSESRGSSLESGTVAEDVEKLLESPSGEPREAPLPTPVTIAVQQGTIEVPLRKRSKTEDSQRDDAPAATSIQDEPWCSFELANGVTQYIRIRVNDSGNWMAVIEVSRDLE